MSNDALALAGLPAELPEDAEYDAVHAAVTATDRGRWFLAEYASRNRHSDTDAVVGAIARIEAAIRAAEPAAKTPMEGSLGAAAEKIADIALELRESAADANLCDALDAAVRELWPTCGEPGNTGANGAGPEAATQTAEPVIEPAAAEAIVAAVPAETTAPGLPAEDLRLAEADTDSTSVTATLPAQDFAPSFDPPAAEPARDGRRWYIEGPDFVFDRPQPPANGAHALTSDEAAQPLPPHLPLLADPGDDPAELFEQRPPVVLTISPPDIIAPASASAHSTATNGAAVRAAPPDPLAPLRALSEEETIALFG